MQQIKFKILNILFSSEQQKYQLNSLNYSFSNIFIIIIFLFKLKIISSTELNYLNEIFSVRARKSLLLTEMASASSSNNNNNVFYNINGNKIAQPPILDDGPFSLWHEKRMIRCIFCINYDDYNNLSTFGCEIGERVQTCLGNFCYMRQHKRPEYFLYTSGCINLTLNGMAAIRNNIAVALTNENNDENVELSRKKRLRLLNKKQKYQQNLIKEKKNKKTTQLCEVGQNVNTCICTNRHLCNNLTVVEPYIEFSDNIFTGIDFDELAHFRFLLPNDPILKEFENQRKNVLGGINRIGGDYLLVRDDLNNSFKNKQKFIYLFLFGSLIMTILKF